MNISYENGQYVIDGAGTIMYSRNDYMLTMDPSCKEAPGITIRNFRLHPEQPYDMSFRGRLRLAWNVFKNPRYYFAVP